MHPAKTTMEWPTLLLLVATYGFWAFGSTALWEWSPVVSVLLVALTIAQHSSLTHEALHGHPFRAEWANHATVFLPLGVLYPYGRFRDLHLAHHYDPNLTDPYDDPESNFQDPAVWARLSPPMQALLRFNNTLAGRILVGTAIGASSFIANDFRAILRGDAAIRRDWALHAAGLGLLALWLGLVAEMPLWAYLLAAYGGNSLIKIRTFLEHRAHEQFRARTVVVEDKGPLSWLFLNNNYHVVHHCHPNLAWYQLPQMYRANRDHYLRRNEAYLYRNYAEIFRDFFFRAKDPVPHPIWPVKKGEPDTPVCETATAAE